MTGRSQVKVAQHGTDSGYQAHKRKGESPCAQCRDAHKAYQAEYYRSHPTKYADLKRANAARSRALWRLAQAHPAEFQVYLDEERDE